MCGHGTIGLLVTLVHLGRIEPGTHKIETPVGVITATLRDEHTVTVRNVPAWRAHKRVAVDVPGIGQVHGDVAWGGNWFFLVNDHGQQVASDNLEDLTDVAWRIRHALTSARVTGDDGAEIDHIELFGPSPIADSRSFVLCPGRAYDRSPCGTGTSAKLACLAADGKLQPGQGFQVLLWKESGSPETADKPVMEKTGGNWRQTIRLSQAPAVKNGGDGAYFWTVALIELTPYKQLGATPAPRPLTYRSQKPAPRPTDTATPFVRLSPAPTIDLRPTPTPTPFGGGRRRF